MSRKLDEPDVWVTEVCKKLTTWWPWVSFHEFDLLFVSIAGMSYIITMPFSCRLLKGRFQLSPQKGTSNAHLNCG